MRRSFHLVQEPDERVGVAGERVDLADDHLGVAWDLRHFALCVQRVRAVAGPVLVGVVGIKDLAQFATRRPACAAIPGSESLFLFSCFAIKPSLDHRTRRHQSTTRRVRGPGLQRCRRRDFYTKETKETKKFVLFRKPTGF